MSLFGVDDEIQLYNASFEQSWQDDASIDDVRFVILDTETTGLDAKKDAIVSIGALTVQNGEIHIDDRFEALIRILHNSATVVVHGVTRERAQASGVDEATALRALLGYLRNAIIVGHHIGFDVQILNESIQRIFGIQLHNRWLDTMELTMHLEDAGMFENDVCHTLPAKADFSLDGLCRRFRIEPHDRHTAAGDAFLTAQVFLKLLRLAKRAGRITLGALLEPFHQDNA